MSLRTRLQNEHFSAPIKSIPSAMAIVIAAGLGFATISMNSTATAQEKPQQTPRQQANNSTENQFPTAQSMEEGLAFAVAQGEVSEQQAASIMRIYKRLAMGVESEKLSVNEALAILEERAIEIYGGVQDKRRAARQEYADAQAAMQKMVDAGEITEDQMNARLKRMREMISASGKKQSDPRKEYEEAVAKMTEMVKAGEITREQMQQRLDRMKAAMDASAKARITRQEYADAQASMQKMVDAGEITEDQMNARLKRMREMISAAGKAPRNLRKEYEAAAAKMAEMVKAGEITREQMEQRLDRMKTKMAAEAQPSVTRADYAKAQADMQKMVDAGEITADQMDARLKRMRQMIGRDKGDQKAEGRERGETSDDCQDLRRRLGEAVRSGTMTRQEAGEIWKSEGC